MHIFKVTIVDFDLLSIPGLISPEQAAWQCGICSFEVKQLYAHSECPHLHCHYCLTWTSSCPHCRKNLRVGTLRRVFLHCNFVRRDDLAEVHRSRPEVPVLSTLPPGKIIDLITDNFKFTFVDIF